jgi:hypothetical protein
VKCAQIKDSWIADQDFGYQIGYGGYSVDEIEILETSIRAAAGLARFRRFAGVNISKCLKIREVLQLCRYPVIGWPDAPHGLFGLRTIQVAPI